MLSFALGFLVSLLITLLIVRYAHLHEKFSTDSDLAGVQKFHVRPVPRIGGAGILIGLIVSAVQLLHAYPAVSGGILGLIACGMPAFGSGLVEDLTKRVSPLARLVCTMAAAALAYFLLDIAVTRISVPPLDFLLSYAVISCAVTVQVRARPFDATGAAGAASTRALRRTQVPTTGQKAPAKRQPRQASQPLSSRSA